MSACRRVLLIGEAPGKAGLPGEPALGGRIGSRLARLMGITVEEYERDFERVNLLPYWPGKASGNGSAWPALEARSAALALRPSMDRRRVVLLGRRVAAAFDERWRWTAWLATLPGQDDRWYIAPHPSGASRWWNDPANVRKAESFWRRLLQKARS